MTAVAVPRKVLVNNKPIRLRFVQQTAWGFLAANAGAMIVSALYYLFVQVKWPGATYGGQMADDILRCYDHQTAVGTFS